MCEGSTACQDWTNAIQGSMGSFYTAPAPKRRRIAANESLESTAPSYQHSQTPTMNPYTSAHVPSSHCFRPAVSIDPSQVSFQEAQTSLMHNSRHNMGSHYTETAPKSHRIATSDSVEAAAPAHQNTQIPTMNSYASDYFASSHCFQPSTSGNLAFSVDPSHASLPKTQESSLHFQHTGQAYPDGNPFFIPIESGSETSYDACYFNVLSCPEDTLWTSTLPIPTLEEMNAFDGTSVTASNDLGHDEGLYGARQSENFDIQPVFPSSFCDVNQDEVVCFGVVS